MEYAGTLKPKTSLGISAFARIIERKAHGYLGAAPAAILRSCKGFWALGPAIETGRLPAWWMPWTIVRV
jgi:hypothetical protein